MPSWWERAFRRSQVRPLELRYFVDVDPAGRQVVRIYRQRGENRQALADVRPLFEYGYREHGADGQTTYVLQAEDWQILQALKSQEPQVRPDGALVFEVLPPVLRYLRAKPAVRETAQSQAVQVEERPLRPAARVDFDPDKGAIVETGLAAPGSQELIPAGQLQVTRDGGYARFGSRFIPLPQRLGDEVQRWLQRGTVEVPPQDVPEFFLRDLVLLRTRFRAVLTDQAQQVQVIEEPSPPDVRVEMNEPGWLDFKVDYGGGDFELPQSLLAAKGPGEKYHRADPNTWIAFDPAAVRAAQEKLARMGAVQTGTGYRVPAAQFADLEDFVREMGGRANLSKAYTDFLGQLTGFQPDNAYPLSPAAEQDLQKAGVTLRPYQRGGIHWLNWLHSNGLHGILADDMGLGKTIQAICALRGAYETSASTQHSLILAPKSVLPHWERELHRYYPEIQTYFYHGQDRQRELLQPAEPHIFITTYGTAAADIEYLAGIPFFYVILDEATQIKNPGTQRTLAVKALNAAHRVALSGTPLENRPAEVWSLFDFLMRGYLGSRGAFERLFENPILSGDRGAAVRLGQRLKPFALRRTKETVARDLPEKIELEEWCELTDEQKRLYGGLQDATRRIREALERGERVSYTANVLPVIQKLKQICDHPALVTGEPLPAILAAGRPAANGDNGQAQAPPASTAAQDVAPSQARQPSPAPSAAGPSPATDAARPAERAPDDEPVPPGETVPETGSAAVPGATQATPSGPERGLAGEPEEPDALFGRSEKFDWIVAKLQEIVQGGEQAVVFSHFLGMLSLLEAALARCAITCIRIDGSTDNRQELIDRFNAAGAQVALCSILAAGYGINLTAANHVIHADRWWNPAVEDQATDRVHRIGQDRTVYVHLILTEGTLEERIDQLLESKRGMAGRVIDAAQSGPGGWTRDEIISLLQPLRQTETR